MAKMIQIRDVPEAVHRELRARAAGAGLSLSEFLRRELERIATTRSASEILADWKAHRADVSSEDIVETIREGRP